MSESETLIRAMERQETIIRLQKEIIDDLFCLLSLHISSEELATLPVINKINIAAQIRDF